MDYHQIMASLAFHYAICQTSYITATAPADPKGWGEGRTKNLLWQQAEDRFIHKYQ